MGKLLLANNASSRLASPLTNTATSLVVLNPAVFPVIVSGSGDWFYLTLSNLVDGTVEVVKVTATVADTYTIERAFDGTIARTWPAAIVELRNNVAAIVDLATTSTTINGHTGSDISLTAADVAAVALGAVGEANGVASLGADAKVPASQLPGAILGALAYQGVWNAATNSPLLDTPSAANKGHYYKVSVAGTTPVESGSGLIDKWAVGDWVISNGAGWDKIDNTDLVASVNGKTGNVSLNAADVNAVALLAVGDANGVAGLDAGRKVPTAQLPDAVLGTMKYHGTWNASMNVPPIPSASASNQGHYYVVSADGTTSISGISSWHAGDWIVSNGTSWNKIDNNPVIPSEMSVDNAAKLGGVAAAAYAMKTDVDWANMTGKPSAYNPNIASQFVLGGVKTGTNVNIAADGTISVTAFTGTVTFDNIALSGTILPSRSNQDIGSASARFRAIYVDEAYLAASTLYLNGAPVLATSVETVMVSASANQGIQISTTGTGQSKMISENGVELSVSGLNADVKVQATGAGGRAVLGATGSIEMTAPATNIHGALTVSQSATFNGDVTFNGTNTVVNTQTVSVKDNIIVLNEGEVGAGVTAGASGLRVDRGSLVDQQLIWDDSDDLWKIGPLNSEVAIATQSWVSASYLATATAASTYAPKASPTFTGTVTAPTFAGALSGTATNATQLGGVDAASYALAANIPVASATTPIMDGTAAVGTATTWARADHVHPNDTSKANADQTFYIGTTQVAINRASASLTLTGVSIDGSAASCTGNAATASAVAWANVSDKPTAVSAFTNDSGYITSSGSCNYATTAGSAPANGGTSDHVTITYNSTAANNYQVLFGSGTSVYGCAAITMNPSTGALTATKVYNAVFNDIADFLELDEALGTIQYGRCYVRTKSGETRLSAAVAEKGIIGIASDTYGYGLGKKDIGTKELPIAIGGFVLAYCDAEYESGDALTSAPGGILTMMPEDLRPMYPERIIATFYKKPEGPTWNGIEVCGRYIVKVR